MERPVTSPQNASFDTPVVVWLDRRNHGAGQRNIHTIGYGTAALQRYGIERLRNDPLWKAAAASLARAQLNPSTVADAARTALYRLAKEAGCLADEATTE